MPVFKYRTFEEAEKALWRFKINDAYYKSLRELFEFEHRLAPSNHPAGVFKYRDLESANKQRMEWHMKSVKYKALTR